MATALSIITAALKKSGVIGVGQTAGAEDANDALDDMNDMLAQWQRKRWLVYHLVDIAFVSTGAQSYTVGSGGNFNVASRPDHIEAAFARLVSATTPIDYPLVVTEAREDYNRVKLKSFSSWPSLLFYDAAFPLGLVYPVAIPQAGIFELHLSIKEQLAAFPTLNTAVNLPPEYVAALKWNLTIRIHASYPGNPSTPEVVALARDSLNVIRNANAQIPEARMPAGLGAQRRYGTNIAAFYSGYR